MNPASNVATNAKEPVIARPFFKFAGGKRQLLPEIRKYIPSKFRRYFEPFVGGGAVFFDLAANGRFQDTADARICSVCDNARLTDTNAEMIDTYLAVTRFLPAVLDALRAHTNDVDHYYAVRAQKPESITLEARAARFLYLNKCGYNGLYRVNKSGGFNVPFGKYENPLICDTENLTAASAVLQKYATVKKCDFATAVSTADQGDFVYCDPPYFPVSKTANFTGYGADGFGPKDQERLRDVAIELIRRGVHVLLSNADVPEVRALYSDRAFVLERVEAKRAINRDANKRGAIGEMLIRGRTPVREHCEWIATSHVYEGWACCRCSTYNGTQRSNCKNCDHKRCEKRE